MAQYTPLSMENATEVLRAFGRGPCTRIEPISAGSVNSNFFVEDRAGRLFLRIYEEQSDVEGVRYELQLLTHLHARGVSVPRPVSGAEPGHVHVAGKLVGLFEVVEGDELCRKQVRDEHLFALGAMLARVHVAGQTFALQRRGRFELSDLSKRIASARKAQRAELSPVLDELERYIAEYSAISASQELPQGAIHGDLFRDNVKWQGTHLSALIDWESASYGILAYDLMVVLLAWCYGDAVEWPRCKKVVEGYQSVRKLSDAEWQSLRTLGMQAALRFTVTRITDYYLRADQYAPGALRDYRRFLSRLHELQALSDAEIRQRLG